MERKPHTNLEAWKVAMDLVVEVYRATGRFPQHERYGLVSQMRRAAVSIPSNIAEGAARSSRKEFANFLSMARGSLSELETQKEIAIRVGLMQQNVYIDKLLDRASRLMTGLHRKIRSTIQR